MSNAINTEPASNSFDTNQVSVANTETLIVAANPTRRAVIITNLGTTAVYLGNSTGVTTGNGDLLPGIVGASVTIPTTAAIYGIAATGSQSVSFLEITD